jgi:hypothetical protein
METLSPFSLPPSIVESRKRTFVDYHAEGVKVEWSDDDEPPPPKPAKKKKAAERPRVVVATVDSFPTTVLSAKASFESVYFVPLDRSLRGQGRGASELSDDHMAAVEEAEAALAESDSVVIFAGEPDLAATLARMATRGKRTGVPMPKDPDLLKFCKKLSSMTPGTMRCAFRALHTVQRRDA